MAESRVRRFWGWGYEAEGPGPEEIAAVEVGLRHFLGVGELAARPRPRLDEIRLPTPRLGIPERLRVVMRVVVDDPGHQREAARVEGFFSRQAWADLGNLSIAHCEVGDDRRGAETVVDLGVSNDEVVHAPILAP